jgi:hypothetical protein
MAQASISVTLRSAGDATAQNSDCAMPRPQVSWRRRGAILATGSFNSSATNSVSSGRPEKSGRSLSASLASKTKRHIRHVIAKIAFLLAGFRKPQSCGDLQRSAKQTPQVQKIWLLRANSKVSGSREGSVRCDHVFNHRFNSEGGSETAFATSLHHYIFADCTGARL